MAQVVKHPERFVGMHFFFPVDRMQLVEVIRGDKTSDETVVTIVELARRLRKTPIVCRDCAGFLVNRILLPYMNEAVLLLLEGASMDQIDKVATQARHTHDAAAAHTGLLAEFGAKLAEYSMAATAANREHAERRNHRRASRKLLGTSPPIFYRRRSVQTSRNSRAKCGRKLFAGERAHNGEKHYPGDHSGNYEIWISRTAIENRRRGQC